ncbi:uncharacterized protein CEXT_627081 [Caerostris extrusa]|uniref:Uncharacterized protein n=1 Tax=Caerostris extrusa TaxID=172846 RepID=A0AAV4QUN1_CAEEX|nr:uncharacterized protein CEXT_627081 [Caerostris extrusa]
MCSIIKESEICCLQGCGRGSFWCPRVQRNNPATERHHVLAHGQNHQHLRVSWRRRAQDAAGTNANDLTIVIGAAIVGAAGLIVVDLNCAYCVALLQVQRETRKSLILILARKSNQVSTRTIGIKSDLCQSILTDRSLFRPERRQKEGITKVILSAVSSPKKRPVSQPVHLPIAFQPDPILPKESTPKLIFEDAFGPAEHTEMAFRTSDIIQMYQPQRGLSG